MNQGIYHDIPFDEYCQIDAVNNSSLGAALISSLHYSTQTRSDNETFRLGRLMHCGVLEPDRVAERYVVMPDFAKSEHNVTTDGKRTASANTQFVKQAKQDFLAANADREVVTESQRDASIEMAKSLAKSYRTREFFERGQYEVTAIWIDQDTGILCKARVDVLQEFQAGVYRITDVKSTAKLPKFERSIAEFGYDRQAAFYMDGFEACGLRVVDFCLCAVESSPPYDSRSAPLECDAIDAGRILYRRALATIAEYRSTGIATGMGDPLSWNTPVGHRTRIMDGALVGFDQ